MDEPWTLARVEAWGLRLAALGQWGPTEVQEVGEVVAFLTAVQAETLQVIQAQRETIQVQLEALQCAQAAKTVLATQRTRQAGLRPLPWSSVPRETDEDTPE